MGNVKQWTNRLFPILIVVGTLPSSRATAQQAGAIIPSALAPTDPKLVYRLDLMTDKLVAMKPADLKAGYTYYHFSPRRNSWSWSYYQKNGSFWHAFGEGTTQEAWSFDIRASRQEVAKRLAEFPELAQRVERYNESVCLRLQADGRWQIVGTGLAPSIFNVETGGRWQVRAADQYIAVVHTNGNNWTVRNGKYYPSRSSSFAQ
jgi:hypothetical protein